MTTPRMAMAKPTRTRNKPSGLRSIESTKIETTYADISRKANDEAFEALEDALAFINDLTGYYVKDCKPTESNIPTLSPSDALWRAEEIFLNLTGLRDPIYSILSPISVDDARHFLSDSFRKHFSVLSANDRERLVELIDQAHSIADKVAETLRNQPGVDTYKVLPKSCELYGDSRRINGTTIATRFGRSR